jgi:integrase
MFEAAQIRALIAAAGTQLRAMILLGINAGFGNADVATLPITALDLAGGWINYPRPKTGVARRVPLWPETVAALKAAIAARPTPKDAADVGLVFITKYGGSWAKATRDNPVSKELAKLLLELKMKRPGLGFYALRHSFETIGGESKDQVAVDSIMGHARYDMPSLYRERVSDERLTALTEFVRKWLFEDAARLD